MSADKVGVESAVLVRAEFRIKKADEPYIPPIIILPPELLDREKKRVRWLLYEMADLCHALDRWVER